MGGVKYTEWHAGEPAVGGMMEMFADYPAETSSFWMTYFAVADLDATTDAAERAGGSVRVRGQDAPPGRFSMIADPQGRRCPSSSCVKSAKYLITGN
jgi:predicted enzyme related to lactoylglutathione lyase